MGVPRAGGSMAPGEIQDRVGRRRARGNRGPTSTSFRLNSSTGAVALVRMLARTGATRLPIT
jgi:hypothetical protein